MKIEEYIECDGLALAKLIQNKEVKPQELLNIAIGLADQLNPAINAIVIPFYDKAFQQIKNGLPPGIFSGVPSLLKNLSTSYKDTIETNGSRYFQDNVCLTTSESVQRFLNQGMVFFGRTNSPELGLSYTTEPSFYGPTHNPWDFTRTPGGSSGGAAAAVASRIVPIAMASDGGGSIRIPAACCGVFGLKPSRCRIPTGPESAEAWASLATQFVISRSVRDSAAALDILGKPQIGSYYPLLAPPTEPYLNSHTQSPKNLKIGLLQNVFADVPIDPECQMALEHAIKLFENLGHHVESVTVKINADPLAKAMYSIIAAHVEYALRYQKSLKNRSYTADDLEPITRYFAEFARHVRSHDMIASKNIIFQTMQPIAQLTTKYDVLLTPALAKPPVLLGEINSFDDFQHFTQKNIEFCPFTSLFNQSGQPAMTVPIYWSKQGLPLSVQCAAAVGNELVLLQLAAQIEEAQPWSTKKPDFLNQLLVSKKLKN